MENEKKDTKFNLEDMEFEVPVMGKALYEALYSIWLLAPDSYVTSPGLQLAYQGGE